MEPIHDNIAKKYTIIVYVFFPPCSHQTIDKNQYNDYCIMMMRKNGSNDP